MKINTCCLFLRFIIRLLTQFFQVICLQCWYCNILKMIFTGIYMFMYYWDDLLKDQASNFHSHFYAHLDFVFKMSISSAICINWKRAGKNLTNPTFEDGWYSKLGPWVCDTNIYILIGSYQHGSYLHTPRMLLAGWLISQLVFTGF